MIVWSTFRCWHRNKSNSSALLRLPALRVCVCVVFLNNISGDKFRGSVAEPTQKRFLYFLAIASFGSSPIGAGGVGRMCRACE